MHKHNFSVPFSPNMNFSLLQQDNESSKTKKGESSYFSKSQVPHVRYVHQNSLEMNNSNLEFCSKLQNEMALGIGDSNLCLCVTNREEPT